MSAPGMPKPLDDRRKRCPFCHQIGHGEDKCPIKNCASCGGSGWRRTVHENGTVLNSKCVCRSPKKAWNR